VKTRTIRTFLHGQLYTALDINDEPGPAGNSIEDFEFAAIPTAEQDTTGVEFSIAASGNYFTAKLDGVSSGLFPTRMPIRRQ
jgi:hypothetical protein